MARHLIKAISLDDGAIGIMDITEGRILGQEKPYKFRSKKEAYRFCAGSWPYDGVWYGRKEHTGYSIEVDL